MLFRKLCNDQQKTTDHNNKAEIINLHKRHCFSFTFECPVGIKIINLYTFFETK